EVTVRVEVDVLEVVDEVRVDVRQRGLVELLDVAEADHLASHPVRHHDDVAPARAAARKLLADLSEELVVVVDLLGVLHVHAGLFGELLERRVLAVIHVDVERPVGEVELRAHLALRDGLLRCGLRPAAQGVAAPAAGGEEGGRAHRHRAGGASPQELAPVDLRGYEFVDQLVDVPFAQVSSTPGSGSVVLSLTTCMWSGAQLSRTRAPAPGSCWRSASLAFGTSTVMVTSSCSLTTIWVAVPRYSELSIMPSTLGRSDGAGSSTRLTWSFSGRTTA